MANVLLNNPSSSLQNHHNNNNGKQHDNNYYVLSLGMLVLDYVVVVDNFPKQDTKQTALKQQLGGGGNAANTAVQLSRLGIKSRLISKVGNDLNGKILMDELKSEQVNIDGVEVEKITIDEENNTKKKTVTSFVMVANDTRTIISMPYEQRISDVSEQFLFNHLSLFNDVSLLHCDGRHLDAAFFAVKIAIEKKINILVEAELRSKALMKIHGEGLRRLLNHATYIVSNKHYPLELHGNNTNSNNNNNNKWKEDTYYCNNNNNNNLNKMEISLLRMLDHYPKCKYLIITLGEEGCIAVKKIKENVYDMYHVDAYNLDTNINPIVDTTGAGDAFIGGFIEGIVHSYPIEMTLKRASFIGAMNCLKGYGARYNMQNKNMMDQAIRKIDTILCKKKTIVL